MSDRLDHRPNQLSGGAEAASGDRAGASGDAVGSAGRRADGGPRLRHCRRGHAPPDPAQPGGAYRNRHHHARPGGFHAVPAPGADPRRHAVRSRRRRAGKRSAMRHTGPAVCRQPPPGVAQPHAREAAHGAGPRRHRDRHRFGDRDDLDRRDRDRRGAQAIRGAWHRHRQHRDEEPQTGAGDRARRRARAGRRGLVDRDRSARHQGWRRFHPRRQAGRRWLFAGGHGVLRGHQQLELAQGRFCRIWTPGASGALPAPRSLPPFVGPARSAYWGPKSTSEDASTGWWAC